MLALRAKDLQGLVTMGEIVEAVDRGFVEMARGTVVMPHRHILDLPDQGGHSYVMPAYLGGQGSLGIKVLNFFRPEGRRERGGGIVVLFDSQAGQPLAIMDPAFITNMRTGAASAVAARYLTPRDFRRVGILGTGNQARTQLLGLQAVRPIESIRAWGRTPERAKAFAKDVARELGLDIVLVDEPREAVEGAQIVVTATNSDEPVLRGTWLPQGCHINAIGGASTNEIDGEVLKRSRIFVDSVEGALAEARDLRLALDAGLIQRGDVVAPLGDVIVGRTPGRRTLQEITLFRSLGLGMQDVATARLVYEAARAAGVGREVEFP